MRLWRLLGMYDAETTAWSALAGTVASPFTPDFNGRLVGLRTIVGAGAANSLTEHIQFRLISNSFTPNSIECAAQGAGLHTAPAIAPAPIEWPVLQSVRVGVDIVIEGRNLTAETPVTNEVYVYGLFEVGAQR